MVKLETEFLSIKEFAGKVGVHPNTVRRAIKNGRLMACDIGSGNKHIYRIARTEIERIALLNLKGIVDKMVEERLTKV
jgi:excisionase family DNA binding protein